MKSDIDEPLLIRLRRYSLEYSCAFRIGVGCVALDPVDLEVELEAVVLGVLLQDVVERRLDDPPRGLLDVGERDPADGSVSEGRGSEHRDPLLQLPLVLDLPGPFFAN